jgi:hypothetical protein
MPGISIVFNIASVGAPCGTIDSPEKNPPSSASDSLIALSNVKVAINAMVQSVQRATVFVGCDCLFQLDRAIRTVEEKINSPGMNWYTPSVGNI